MGFGYASEEFKGAPNKPEQVVNLLKEKRIGQCIPRAVGVGKLGK